MTKKAERPVYWAGLRFMPDPDWPRAAVIEVEEYPHAWLVIGTSDMNLAARELARQTDEIVDQAHALAFPRRPFHHEEYGSCVAFYLQVSGERVSVKEKEQIIKRNRKESRG